MSDAGLDHEHVRLCVIRPALQAIGLWTQDAENLVLGTGLQESRLRFLKQNHGPALGLFQMEPATHEDLWTNYIPAHASISQPLLGMVAARGALIPQLMWNLQYAAAMCRILYHRIQAPLPSGALEQATYYKHFYNTPAGAATVEGALPFFQLACGVTP